MDVISILRKMRQEVTSYEVVVTGERAEEHPRVYTSIDVRHIVRGAPLAESSVRRAIQLSISGYCPVYAMLSPAVPITVRYEVTDEGTNAEAQGTVERAAAEA
jgi:putative redox protein